MQGTFQRASRAVRWLSCDESVAVAEVGAICVVVWRGAVTKAPFQQQRSGLADVVGRHPEGTGFLCVIERSAKPPDGDELRRASSEMISEHGGILKCVACVVEGEGFRSAINRGALAGMVLLLRNKKSAISVFAKVHDAAAWMSQHVELHSASELSSSVEVIRSRLPEPPQSK